MESPVGHSHSNSQPEPMAQATKLPSAGALSPSPPTHPCAMSGSKPRLGRSLEPPLGVEPRTYPLRMRHSANRAKVALFSILPAPEGNSKPDPFQIPFRVAYLPALNTHETQAGVHFRDAPAVPHPLITNQPANSSRPPQPPRLRDCNPQ